MQEEKHLAPRPNSSRCVREPSAVRLLFRIEVSKAAQAGAT
jgi:hypothetical protein